MSLNFRTILHLAMLSLAAGILATTWVASAAEGTGAALVVHASGFTHASGHAVAKLFRPGDDVLGKGHWQATSPIRDGQASFSFNELAPGQYAVVVFHDENDNGTIDHNGFGVPSEPLGFSNGFTLNLISGLPTFDKLRFTHQAGEQHLEIEVR